MLTVKGLNAGSHVSRWGKEQRVGDGQGECYNNVLVPIVPFFLAWGGIGQCYQSVTLPDEALLNVFDFYVNQSLLEQWITLAHVCQRWRHIIFASPLRLNLTLFCKGSKPVREMLDIWPPLPILIQDHRCPKEGADNIIAALEHNDRVCQISIEVEEVLSSVLGRFAKAMQEPFPKLTHLGLWSANETTLVIPE